MVIKGVPHGEQNFSSVVKAFAHLRQRGVVISAPRILSIKCIAMTCLQHVLLSADSIADEEDETHHTKVAGGG
jgi:hypothetical protein